MTFLLLLLFVMRTLRGTNLLAGLYAVAFDRDKTLRRTGRLFRRDLLCVRPDAGTRLGQAEERVVDVLNAEPVP